jgi:hypothetical protein
LKPKQALYGATETVGTGEDKSDRFTADSLDLNLQLALEKRNSRTTITPFLEQKSWSTNGVPGHWWWITFVVVTAWSISIAIIKIAASRAQQQLQHLPSDSSLRLSRRYHQLWKSCTKRSAMAVIN